MGAAAFLIPEFIPGVTYFDVVVAAIIPALLYYLGVSSGIYFNARRQKIPKLSGKDAATVKDILHEWRGLIVLTVLVTVLIGLFAKRYPTGTCGAWSLAVAATLHFLIGGSWKGSAFKKRFIDMLDGFTRGGFALCWLFMFLALLQVVVLVLNTTGLGLAISATIRELSSHNFLLTLMAAMVATGIMGMGITTTAAYVIVVAIMAPVLVEIFHNPLQAHLYIFWFALLGNITPPVCAAIYPAAAIAGVHWLPVALKACRLGIGLFILPYFFAYDASLLLMGSFGSVVWAIIRSTVGIIFLSSAIWGYFYISSVWVERILMGVGGLALIAPGIKADISGFILILFGLAVHFVRNRRIGDAQEFKLRP
jgi:TRAP-type uncharacterized transport system fused permease subunit